MSVQQNQSFGYAFTGLLGLVNWYSVCFVVQMLAFVTEIPELKLEDFYCSLESVCLTVYSFWPLAKHFRLHKRPSAITKHLCWMFLHMQYLCADNRFWETGVWKWFSFFAFSFFARCMLLGHYLRGLEYRVELMELLTLSNNAENSNNAGEQAS